MTSCLQMALLVVALLVVVCSAGKESVSFDDHNICDERIKVGPDTEVVVTGERADATGQSSAFSRCELLFDGELASDRLCLKIDKLIFKNTKLQLDYHNNFDHDSTAPFKSFKKGDQISFPKEYCSTGREMSLQLQPRNSSVSASIRDVEMSLVVNNMHGNKRIGYMDRDCGVNYDIDNSTIHVLNRPDGATVNPMSPCRMDFKYVGSNTNFTVCLQFTRSKESCGYELEVYDGTPADFITTNIKYTCKNSQPQVWCSKKNAFYLELRRDNPQADEPSSLFSVQVKDGVQGQVKFPVLPQPGADPFPTWAIVVIAIVAVAAVAGAAFGVKKICDKKKSGDGDYTPPKNQHEAA